MNLTDPFLKRVVVGIFPPWATGLFANRKVPYRTNAEGNPVYRLP